MQPFAADSDVARELAIIIQRDLLQREIATDESDTTIAEYLAAMIGDGTKIAERVTQEASEFIPLDAEQLAQFVTWAYEQAAILQGANENPMDVATGVEQAPVQPESAPVAPAEQDVTMEGEDEMTEVYVCPTCIRKVGKDILANSTCIDERSQALMCWRDIIHAVVKLTPFRRSRPTDVPSGPKSMRGGGRGGVEAGRGRRVMNQLNKHMDRSQPAGISSNRITSGRVDTRRGRQPPRGPATRGNLAQGITRTMQQNMRGGFNNPMMQGGGSGGMNGANAMQMAQFMETATALMAQMAGQQQQGNQTVYNPNFRGGRGGRGGRGMNIMRGGRGGQRGGAQHINGISNGDSNSMDVSMDTPFDDQKDAFDTECRFNAYCTNPQCHYAHQSPAALGKTAIDLSDTCPHKAACQNHKCSAKHPSPALRNQHNNNNNNQSAPHTPSNPNFSQPKNMVKCRFDAHCTREGCPFQHSTVPPCKNGPDCDVRGCKFTHSEIPCRYDPCTKQGLCTFKHKPGQRQEGGFKDKVWTAGEKANGGTSERLAGLAAEGQGEELILPGKNGEVDGNGNGDGVVQAGVPGQQASSQDMETQIVT